MKKNLTSLVLAGSLLGSATVASAQRTDVNFAFGGATANSANALDAFAVQNPASGLDQVLLAIRAQGLDAIKWWREGKYREVAEYCCYDVKVTKLVHEYGARHGFVKYDDKFGQIQEAQVDWSLPE